MVDPVGAALGCVGLLDPVYTRIRIVLKAYETTTRFGKDFNNSYSQLHMEEWSFKGSLDKYGCYLAMLRKSGTEFDREQPVLRTDIETQVTSMVYVFNDCYSIVKKYDTQSKDVDENRQGEPSHSANFQTTGQGNSTSGLASSGENPSARHDGKLVMPQAKCKPSKRLDIDKIRKSTVSFFRSKNSSATSCQTGSGTSGDPLSRSSTKSAPTTISTRGEESQKQIQAPTTSSELSRIRFSGDGDNVIFHGIDSTQPATSSSNNQRFSTKKIWQNRIKEWQDNISINRKITWADHGKEEFDELLLKLSAMNTQLRNVVPQLQLQNPLQKLRGGRDAPTLWNDTKLIREALGDLHLALGVVNPQEIDKELKLAVRLEENHNEGKMWMEEMGLLNGLKRRQDASFFSLMGTFRCQETYIAKKPGVFLISGTISQGRQQDIEVENLPQTLQGLPINTEFSGKSFEEIGNVSLDSQRIYSLRQIIWPEEERWLENQTLHDIIDNDAFTPKERILIAAKVAVAHIHFASVYPRFAHRQLGSYRFFRQSFETPQDWNQPFVRSSWLEYEFGSPVTPRRARLSSRSQVLSDKIDPAVELGVLLYQITSGKRLEYALTASGLKNSETAAMASIEDVEEMCATYVKEIVQACFLKTPPPKREEPNDPAFCIIEEVAAALIAQAETL